MDKLLNTTAGVGLGAYLIAVAVHGNLYQPGATDTLSHQIMTDADYIEFVIALAALGALMKWGPTSGVTDALVAMAIVAFLLKVANNNKALLTALANFGQPGFFGQLTSALGVNTNAG